MVVVTSPLPPAARTGLGPKHRDTLHLSWEERRWTRRRVRSTAGREVALALPTGSLLRPGDLLAIGEDWYLEVEGRPEPVLRVRPRDRAEAVRVAFDVGNRHFPLALAGELLLVPEDTAMVQLLERLGVPWERGEAVFDPIGGPGPHGHGESPLDGHRHS
jgi:urease accessory protein